MLKALTAALAGIALSIQPASATPSNFNAHVELANTIMNAGVSFYVNPESCADRNALGWYAGKRRELVVCQENGTPGGEQVIWTEEDFDTLRHEAHHFAQDCIAGTNHDHRLGTTHNTPIKLARNVLGDANAQRIVNAYLANGANEQTLILELEAFAVAHLNDPYLQISLIRRYCG